MYGRVSHIERALKTVFGERRYQLLGAGSFLALVTLYAFTLPATYTGGRVGLVSLRLLTPTLAGFAVVLSGLVAVLVPFNLYTLDLGAEAGTATTTSGFLGSILPPLLCCSPLIPGLIAMVGAVFPAVAGTSGVIQGFIAVYEMEILAGATVLLLYAVHRSAQTVHGCNC